MKNNDSKKSYPPDEITNLSISNLKYSFLVASLEMDVYKKIGNKKFTIDQFAKIIGLSYYSARALGQNLANMDLLIYKNGFISNSRLSNQWLKNDKLTNKLIKWLSDYSPSPTELINILKNPSGQPWYTIKKNSHNFFFKTFKKEPIDKSFYTDAHDLRIRWGEEISENYDFSKHTHLLDVGGACGGWTVGILKKYSNLSATIFERPEIINISREIIGKHPKLKHKINFMSGDFFLPMRTTSCDVVLLANVLHDWSIEDCEKILKNIKSSVSKKSTFLIKEFFFDNEWKNSDYGALQSMLVLGPKKESGWQPTYKEMNELLKKTGFHNIVTIKKSSLVIAKA